MGSERFAGKKKPPSRPNPPSSALRIAIARERCVSSPYQAVRRPGWTREAGRAPAMNRAVFDALKPGGVYLVIDHSAEPGSGARDTESLHRVDEAMVREEVIAAGFRVEAESKVLRNAEDPRDGNVFKAPIRGRTDRFVFKFVKPGGGSVAERERDGP